MTESTSRPLVTVIIPVYNMEQYLSETILSVLDSSYSEIEIIIVDDGSTDSSMLIANDFAKQFSAIKIFKQENKGVAAARNLAISKANGKYILPVDADDLIAPDLIEKAIEVIENEPDVKVVTCNANFFGEKKGEWELPSFSLNKLAKKNIISATSLFRIDDWKRAGGYCEFIKGREDWEFWISVLKYGGRVVNLPEIGMHYRIRNNSKRITDRKHKRQVIDVLNARHKAFFEKQLGGKLRYNRSWSRLFNFINSLFCSKKVFVRKEFIVADEFIYSLPERFKSEGLLLHKERNEVKKFETIGKSIVVKKFGKPNFLNRIIYGNFRKSKAERSYLYAEKLLSMEISTPEPIGFVEKKILFFFDDSYYICLHSACKNCFRDLEKNYDFDERKNILKEVGRFTAKMHQKGIIHTDYSGGNILIDLDENKKLNFEILDLNRIRFRNIDIKTGCKNFERLNVSDESLEILATEYALARNFNIENCISLVKNYRWKKHRK